MAQSQTGIGTKSNTPPNNELTAAEFNTLDDVINDNAIDAESRLTTREAASGTISSSLTIEEGRSISVLSWPTSALPLSADNGVVALDTTLNTLVYHKDDIWYKASDNSIVISYVPPTTTTTPTTVTPTTVTPTTTMPPLGTFDFSVKTDNTGTSNSDQFTLPLYPGNNYDFYVNWGDGTSDTVSSDVDFTHTFNGGAGTYNVSISGQIEGVKFNNGGDKEKLIEISDFGQLSFDSDATDAFYGCSNLTISAADGPITSASTDFLWFYYLCSSLTSVPLMDLSSGNRYFAMFRDCQNITSLPDFDFSSGTNTAKYREMFRNMRVLTTLDNCMFGDSRSDPRYMFRDCWALTSLPSTLDFTNGGNFTQTFMNCYSLSDFSSMDTSNATIFERTWQSCTSLTDFPALSAQNVSNFGYAWWGCSSLSAFPLLDLSSGTNFERAWEGCALDSNSIDNVLAALVTNGATGLFTELSGGTNLPESSWSAQASADVATLRSRGWWISSN